MSSSLEVHKNVEMVYITVQIDGSICSPSQSVHVTLNLNDSLSNIRQELRNHIKNIDMRTLSFDLKTTKSQIICAAEDEFFLYEIVDNNILYLSKNSKPNNPSYNFLNEKCKFDHGLVK